MESWIFTLILCVCIILLIVFGFALWSGQKTKESKNNKKAIPTAKELLELLRDKNNTLEDLQTYSNTAYTYYERYMQENNDFDLEFIAILTAHKSVNAKLILEIERKFKSINPARKALLDQALTLGLGHR
ncbi:hypothetical protein [Helicobacter winghamensis]|uniref:hypothetical protein n=1 Tax=Helicobacter winghamensis TaxID=157268 RepID=UPI00242A3F5D|nr:hypothetical protein [Helicobacter winghamensis]